MASDDGEPEECLFKVLVIGDVGTGKTSLIKRYVHNLFNQHYKSTIGVDFALKVLHWDDGKTVIRLQLWDIAGQERFGSMTRVYYKEAVGAFIVYDVTRPATFEAIEKWKNDVDNKVMLTEEQRIPCVLLANKCDLPSDVSLKGRKEMDDMCKDMGFHAWYETSAKDNTNVEEAANSLVRKILENDRIIRAQGRNEPEDTIKLSGGQASSRSGGCPC